MNVSWCKIIVTFKIIWHLNIKKNFVSILTRFLALQDKILFKIND